LQLGQSSGFRPKHWSLHSI